MIEAVENHMPEVIVIDEIGNQAEAEAARTIAERGVQLIGTAHGQTLENLMLNPSLADLIGGIQAVTLSDDEARRRGTQKTVLERKSPPTFDVVIELLEYDRVAVHHNVMKTVDLVLRGVPPKPEIRVRTSPGRMEVVQQEVAPDIDAPGFNERFPSLSRAEKETSRETNGVKGVEKTVRVARPPKDPKPTPQVLRVYPYGIARTRLERAIRERKVNAYIVTDIGQADAVIAMRSTYQAQPAKLKNLGRPVAIQVVKSNTFAQIAAALDQLASGAGQPGESEEQALSEVSQAIDQVLLTGKPVELKPQDARTRKMQMQLVEVKKLAVEAVGQEPERRVRVLPTRIA
jgi:hypothetical protein